MGYQRVWEITGIQIKSKVVTFGIERSIKSNQADRSSNLIKQIVYLQFL